ncbi:DUF2059 domain-containing protein [Flavobacterium sp. NRK1]|jgi:hypothetical protein|uniref:DUF2059 domain-containing protein n=1 Tax=Flavobacterium sp. NRK1 TaxID=2954929 RepID=UPI002092B90A|nr:DUF2059 domain-containing protein [Flavobacterium sp. NRK1]MCO6147049.1 DUF2059 domain-containing protein [Flavobacterium sp. NRK1]
MKKLLLAAVFMLVAQVTMAQTADATFKADAIKVLNLSGFATQFEMLTKDIVKNVPAEKQAEFKKDLDASIQDLIAKIADIYMQEFTHEDIKAMLKYYESPVGKKFASKTGVLFEKGQAAGQEWGMGLQGVMAKYME